MDEKTRAQLEQIWQQVQVVIHDPVKIRFALTALALGGWYVAAYMPVNEQTLALSRELEEQRKKVVMAAQIQELKAERQRFLDQLPEGDSPTAWRQHVLREIERRGLVVSSMRLQGTPAIAERPTQGLELSVQGSYPELQDFLRWFETEPRLFRITGFSLNPGEPDPEHPEREPMALHLTVMGLLGDPAPEPAPGAQDKDADGDDDD